MRNDYLSPYTRIGCRISILFSTDQSTRHEHRIRLHLHEIARLERSVFKSIIRLSGKRPEPTAHARMEEYTRMLEIVRDARVAIYQHNERWERALEEAGDLT